MSFNQVSAASLTPSRPAPQAPQRRGNDNSQAMYTTNTALASSGYNASFALTPASPSGSSYASSYSGIGGSPNRNSEAAFNSHVVRSGTVSIKEDGFASWLWRPKWLVLKEQTLSIHKTEVRILFVIVYLCSRCHHAMVQSCCTASVMYALPRSGSFRRTRLCRVKLFSMAPYGLLIIHPPDCDPTKHHLPTRHSQY